MLKYTRNINLVRNFNKSAFHFNRLFTKEHEWLLPDKEKKIGIVGITNHAQNALGDVVYVEMPELQKSYVKGEVCGALESVKAASEIYSPITGKIVAKNENVENNPGLINKSCHDEGWLFKITMDKADEVSSLMTEDGYNAFLKTKT